MDLHQRVGICGLVRLSIIVLEALSLTYTSPCHAQTAASNKGSPDKNAKQSSVAIDLLKRINTKRDTVSGEFRLENGRLIHRGGGDRRIYLPYQPPLDYDLIAEIKRVDASDGAFVFLLLLNGKQTMVAVDSYRMQTTGLTFVDGADLDSVKNDSAHRKTVLPQGSLTQIRLVVRGAKVQIYAGDTRIVDWQGKQSRLSLPENWATPNPKALAIGSTVSQFEVSRLEIIPVRPTIATGSDPQSNNGIEGSLEITKNAIPSSTVQSDARKVIRELFKKDFEPAKTPKAKLVLAQTLLSRAAEFQNDPTSLYAILAESAENAAAGGDIALAMKALDDVNEQFAASGFELKEKVAKTAIPLAKTTDQILTLIDLNQNLIREALVADDIAVAERSSQNVLTLARKSDLPVLKDQLSSLPKDITTIKLALKSVESARQKLKEHPEDPALNLVCGKFSCYIKADWPNGLLMLAQSQDPVLASLAKRDLDQPADADAFVRLGDDWWAVGDKEKDLARTNIYLHAAEFYYRALPGLSGINLTTVERKIARLFNGAQVYSAAGDPMGTPIADGALNLGASSTVECWVQTAASENALFSKRGQEPEGSLGVRMYGGHATLFENASFHYVETRTDVSLNDRAWHHLAIVKSGTKAALFIDGKHAANLDVREELSSKSPWKLGTSFGFQPIAVNACKFRISNIARYIVSFKPDYNYKRDKWTVYLSDLK